MIKDNTFHGKPLYVVGEINLKLFLFFQMIDEIYMFHYDNHIEIWIFKIHRANAHTIYKDNIGILYVL